MEAITSRLRDMGFGDAALSSAAAHFSAASPPPTLDAVIDFILLQPQPEAAPAAAQSSGGTASAAVAAPPLGPQEGEFPCGSHIRVTSFGETYATHDEFIDSLGVRCAAGFAYNECGVVRRDGALGVVVASILRSEVPGGCAYAVKMDKSQRIFVIGVTGIEVVEAFQPCPASAPPAPEFEYFPRETAAAACELSHVALVRAAKDADGVISPADGLLPHIPTVAKAFGERFRACANAAAFQAELQQLWRVLFRPHDASRASPLAMTHGAAFEFAINELMLACEEQHYAEQLPAAAGNRLAPLDFLKRDAAFLSFVSSQLRQPPPVASVLPRLLQSFLAAGDAGLFVALLDVPRPSPDDFGFDSDENAVAAALCRQMSQLSRANAAVMRLLGSEFSILGPRARPIASAIMRKICDAAPDAVLKTPPDDKADCPLFSNAAFVLGVNLLSLMLTRLLSSISSISPSHIEVLEFLLQFVEIGWKTGTSAQLPAKCHSFVKRFMSKCMICARCSFCTGYGQNCCNCGARDRSADRGKPCGCGVGKSGCQDCGLCESCGLQVPCGLSSAPSKSPASEEDVLLRLNYAAHVFAAAVSAHCHAAAGELSPPQLCEMWCATSCDHLQHLAAKALSRVQQILMTARLVLLKGLVSAAPPESLISRFAGLTFEEQQAASSDQQLVNSVPSDVVFKIVCAADAGLASMMTRRLIAACPPKDSVSRQILDDFLNAVQRASECAVLPLQETPLRWGAHTSSKGCGPECSQSHSSDGNCLVCGSSWGTHSGHTCQAAPFSGSRGSWLTSKALPVAPAHCEESSPGTFNVALDPKPAVMQGVQSDLPLKSDVGREVGVVITFNITHSSQASPQVLVGLTAAPPPLTAPIASRVSLGLDLGNLAFIGDAGRAPDNLKAEMKRSISFSPDVIKVTIVFLGASALFFINRVLIAAVAVPGSLHFAIIASSEQAHVSISSRRELVRSSGERSSATLQTGKPNESQAAASAATTFREMPIEQTLSWHLSKHFNDDPLIRINLKNGARLLAAMVNSSAEALIQALILRNYLSGLNLTAVRRAVSSRLDAAIASSLLTIGIEPVIEHPSLTPQVLDALLCVCTFEKRQTLLPVVIKLLQSCASDILQGRTARAKPFETLLLLLTRMTHGFGCASLSAFDMLRRFVVPILPSTCSDGGNIINQVIIPRWVIENIFPAKSISQVLSFSGVRVAALAACGWADIRREGRPSVRVSLEAASIYCIILQKCSIDNDLPQSPKTPSSKAALERAIRSSGLLPSAAEAALAELQSQGLLSQCLCSADADQAWSSLSTSTLPRSFTTSSDGLPALQWIFSQLFEHLVLDEALAAVSCCVEMGITPAIFASCLVDLERRGFIERVRGWIVLLAADVDSSKLHCSSESSSETSLLARHIHAQGDDSVIPPCFESIVVFTPNISADEYGCSCSPWTSSFSSAATIPTADMEREFLNMIQNLTVANAKIRSQAMDELLICHVLKQGGGSIAELARASLLHRHEVPHSQSFAPCGGGKLCEICAQENGASVHKLPFGHSFQFCPVCLEDKPCIFLACGHAFCLDDLQQQVATAMADAETPLAAKGGAAGGGQSLFELSCPECATRLPFSFLCAIAPDMAGKLRKRLFAALLTSISGGSSPFARCSCSQTVFIGVSHECEVICDVCGLQTTVGDCKRGIPTGSLVPHPGVSSDSAFQW